MILAATCRNSVADFLGSAVASSRSSRRRRVQARRSRAARLSSIQAALKGKRREGEAAEASGLAAPDVVLKCDVCPVADLQELR